jgi:hypothetical protein
LQELSWLFDPSLLTRSNLYWALTLYQVWGRKMNKMWSLQIAHSYYRLQGNLTLILGLSRLREHFIWGGPTIVRLYVRISWELLNNLDVHLMTIKSESLKGGT